ncbi:MAG: Fibronectin-binding protein / Fibrinogen-bindingprotein [candidate division NC10 bacterium CSP1-5]|nr:MAG: Fibronectin-binding protein / Fibrinogen-bindingprotein [candidate division NC10 bacterium CSP1-5]
MMHEWKVTQQRYGRLLRQRIRRLMRRREKILADLAKARGWEELRRKGELLRVHHQRIGRGLAEVTVPDYYAEAGRPLTIALDPALSVDANAERYFKQARKVKRGLPVIERRLGETEGELKEWESALDRVIQAETAEAVDRAKTAHRLERLEPPPLKPPPRDEGAARCEPRRYLSTDGREILVGRSSAGNEHLTFRLARPHDLWLHVEGYGGSHVVVRNPKGQTVPPRTLREAAMLAAFFSKARNAGKVPVHYTAARFVRRAKRAKPGTVLITQEKTIVVRPDPAAVAGLAGRGAAGAGIASRQNQ